MSAVRPWVRPKPTQNAQKSANISTVGPHKSTQTANKSYTTVHKSHTTDNKARTSDNIPITPTQMEALDPFDDERAGRVCMILEEWDIWRTAGLNLAL